ncbi:MAG: lipocalin family protein [Candidatus Symbiothrix sp.]|nr:lipocalin family protein [Candidatus Symbiothrix sp.]
MLPTLIDMLNTISEAQAYSFNADKSYSQYWISDQPDDPLYEEKGTYELNDRDLTITYTDGQTDEIKTATYKIVSLSDTQLVLYKEILGIWGSLAVAIVEPFDKLGITPKSVYKIITYTNVLEEEGTEKE